jgi:hypothetical protein
MEHLNDMIGVAQVYDLRTDPKLADANYAGKKELKEKRHLWSIVKLKRYPAEVLSPDTARVICFFYSERGGEARKQVLQVFQFTRIDGKWYRTGPLPKEEFPQELQITLPPADTAKDVFPPGSKF